MSEEKSGASWAAASIFQSEKRRRKARGIFASIALAASKMALLNDEDVNAAACCQSYQTNVHVVVHVGKLVWVHGRIDMTRDGPRRRATATRRVRQPDSGAMTSGERVDRGAHFIVVGANE